MANRFRVRVTDCCASVAKTPATSPAGIALFLTGLLGPILTFAALVRLVTT